MDEINSAPTAPITPAPAAPAPVLTPEEKAAKKKAMLKRLTIVSGVSYVVILIFIFVWATLSYGKEFSLFDYLPISQKGFSGFWMVIFNLMVGVLVVATLLYSLFNVLKSLFIKKEELEKKKHASRMALYSGISFLVLAVLWLVGIWFLGPRLTTSDSGSPIVTDPEITIGLTSPVAVGFDAGGVPIDEDVYTILSYTWNFGDGSTGSGVSTSHTYNQKAEGDGIYTVSLNVSYMDLKSGAKFENEYKKEVVIENEMTAATFIATPDSGEVPLTVEFDASGSFDPDGEIVSWEWDFDGDGRFDDATGEVVEYEFTQEGSYEVTLRVTDNNGESALATETIEAGSVGGLRAVITPPIGEGDSFYVGEEYEFEGKLSQIAEGKIVKYVWDMGDGSATKQSSKVTYEFETTGTYEVTLTIYDKDGNTDSTILEVTVIEEGEAPVPDISTVPAASGGVVSGSVPFEVDFDATGSKDPEDDIIDYEWDFDNDGSVDDTGTAASYTYEEVGAYEARLIVTDSVGNTEETAVSIEVTEQGVVADLESDLSNGEVPLTVKFDASGSTYKEGSIASYDYDFGDGSTYTGGSTVTYKYTDVGTFMVTLTVTGTDGKKDTDSVQVVVRPVALTACFTVNTDSGNAPLFVSVDSNCSQGTVDTYEWNFGDGEISYDRKPAVHTYAEAGAYTITLEVTGDTGVVDSFSKTITVK